MGMTAELSGAEQADLQSPAASHRLSVRSAINTLGWNVVVALPGATAPQRGGRCDRGGSSFVPTIPMC
jgi:hypothetical protein